MFINIRVLRLRSTDWKSSLKMGYVLLFLKNISPQKQTKKVVTSRLGKFLLLLITFPRLHTTILKLRNLMTKKGFFLYVHF